MWIMTSRAMSLLDGPVNVGLLKQRLFFLMAGVAELSVGKKGLVIVIRCMGAVARKAIALVYRLMNVVLHKGCLAFSVATIAEYCPFFLYVQGPGRFRPVMARGAPVLIKGRMHGFPKQSRIGRRMRRMTRHT